MQWSKEQTKAHADSAEKFRVAYVAGENKNASLEDIKNCRRRCVSLIEPVRVGPRAYQLPLSLINELINTSPGSYLQEMPHFTIDCHRYVGEDKLPPDINHKRFKVQQRLVISASEFEDYDRVLREEVGRERVFPVELKGVAFGGDGLVAQVWYDNARLQDFNDRLGERVRKVVPSMDFVWGMVKGRVPYRIVSLTRFTGDEDRMKMLDFVDANKDLGIGDFDMKKFWLMFSDHYIQNRNTGELGVYPLQTS